MNRSELISRAITFFTTKNYKTQTQTDYVVVFESESREVNWVIFLVLCCLGIIGAAIYYYFFCPKHQVTVSLSGEMEVKVTAIGNTEQAKKDAADFMKIIQ
jgi:hypothetical protein